MARQLLTAQTCYYIYRRVPTTPTRKEPTIRDAARIFKYRKIQIGKQYKALYDIGLLALSPNQVRRLRSLYEDEDATLEAYVHWLIQSGFILLVIYDLIEDTTNRLYIRRIPPIGPVSRIQQLRQKYDHLQFWTILYRAIEIVRLSIEESIAIFDQFYNKLEDIVETYRITISIYQNIDKIGCYIAILSRKVQVLAIQIEKNRLVSYQPRILSRYQKKYLLQ